MPDADPYATLGVPRSATRAEVARAYRRLAKQWHPDAGATPEEQTSRAAFMARINRAWNLLSNPTRRARWDAAHPTGSPAPHWRPGQPAPVSSGGVGGAAGTWTPPVAQRPFRAPAAPASARDSAWFAAVVAAGVAALIGTAVFLIALGAASEPNPLWDEAETFSRGGLTLAHPAEWTAYEGRDDPRGSQAVIAHVVTFSDLAAHEVCGSFDDPCALSIEGVPAGEASMIVTSWRGGSPPIDDPVRPLPVGLDARFVGDLATVFRLDRRDGGALAWWQVSTPDFPDRWFEVHATIAGGLIEQDEGIAQVEALISTFRFGD